MFFVFKVVRFLLVYNMLSKPRDFFFKICYKTYKNTCKDENKVVTLQCKNRFINP